MQWFWIIKSIRYPFVCGVSSAKESTHAKSVIVYQISVKTFLAALLRYSFFLPRCYSFIFKFSVSRTDSRLRTIVLRTCICINQRFLNIFDVFSCDYLRKHYAVVFGEMSETCFTTFETIRFYSIEKSLFLHVFSSSALPFSSSNIF